MVLDESDLVRQSANGDHSAYQLLLDRHLFSVSNFVMRMMANTTEAEDIIQETFIRLWTHGYKFDPGKAQLSTWLHNIAHNLCIDYFRKFNRVVNEPTEDKVSNQAGPEEKAMQADMSATVQEAMMKLPERQRSAIIMCHYQGLSNKDAAMILDISIDALESLMARGRKKLKQMLIVEGQLP
jgi:RNA polymerase sigma-70 factor (ECF subfamily)